MICTEGELSWLSDIEMPRIIVAKKVMNPLPECPKVIGWIEE